MLLAPTFSSIAIFIHGCCWVLCNLEFISEVLILLLLLDSVTVQLPLDTVAHIYCPLDILNSVQGYTNYGGDIFRVDLYMKQT